MHRAASRSCSLRPFPVAPSHATLSWWFPQEPSLPLPPLGIKPLSLPPAPRRQRCFIPCAHPQGSPRGKGTAAIPCILLGASRCAFPIAPSPPTALTNLHLLADLYQLRHLVFQFAVAFNQVGEIRLQGLLQVQKRERRKRDKTERSAKPEDRPQSPIGDRDHLPPNTPPAGAAT